MKANSSQANSRSKPSPSASPTATRNTAPVSPVRIRKLFEFHPDGRDREPNGPGMYTWWGRLLESNANIGRIHRRASTAEIPPGLAGGLILFPDDVSEGIVNALVERARLQLDAQHGVQVSSYHAFQGTWKQGHHEWSIRSHVIDIAGVFRKDFFRAAIDIFRCAKCDYLVVRHGGATYVLSEPPPIAPGFFARFRRACAAWRKAFSANPDEDYV